MKKYKYLKVSSSKKLRYLDISNKNKLYIIFLHGFMSDIEGKKPKTFKKFAIKNDLGFLTLEYSMNLFKDYKKQIKGFLGIGAAPEFLTRLMWNKFSNKIKQEIKQKGFANIETGGYKYPISSQLIKDGMQNKVLSKKLNLKIPVTMIHGQKDEVVPVLFSKKVLSSFNKAKKKLVVIKNGDHSLSGKIPLKKICSELKVIIKNIV